MLTAGLVRGISHTEMSYSRPSHTCDVIWGLRVVPADRNFGPGSFRTPLDFVFYLSIVNSIFAVLGFAGVLNGQRELVTGFFLYNAVQMVRPLRCGWSCHVMLRWPPPRDRTKWR